MRDKTPEVKKATLTLGTALYESAELLKAFVVLSHVPLALEDDKDVKRLFHRVKRRLDTISSYQRDNRPMIGFSYPHNVRTKAAYVYLKEKLDALPHLRYLVDVGCYNGWLGRYLGLAGYRVHGIDTDEQTLQVARYLASGLHLVTYEKLTAEELGMTHPNTYHGAIAFDVLEHLFDTEVGLQSIENSVVPGGFLFINLPMIENPSELRYTKSKISTDINKEHIHVFPRERVLELFSQKEDVSIDVIKGENDINNWFISYKKSE